MSFKSLLFNWPPVTAESILADAMNVVETITPAIYDSDKTLNDIGANMRKPL